VPAEEIVRASEIASFAYCARAWWLGHVKGIPSAHPSRMRAGTLGHRAHGRRVSLAIWLRRLGLCLVGLALLALVALVVVWGRG
jgi:hypothetical protein